MFCSFCGKEIPDDALFCAHCGQKLTQQAAGQQPAQAPRQPQAQQPAQAPQSPRPQQPQPRQAGPQAGWQNGQQAGWQTGPQTYGRQPVNPAGAVQKESTGLRFVAGALFIIYAVFGIINLFQIRFFHLPTVLTVAGAIVLALAAFLAVPALVSVGSVIMGASLLIGSFGFARYIIDSVLNGYSDLSMVGQLIGMVFGLIAWLVLLIAGISPKSAAVLGIIAAAAAFLRPLIMMIANVIVYGFPSLSTLWLVQSVILVAAIALLGFSVRKIRK